MQYLKKQGLSKEDGLEFLAKKGIDSIPDSEWLLKRVNKHRSAASDTSSEGVRTTCRRVPLKGSAKCPKGDCHLGINGSRLRVEVNQETGDVMKINSSNWTDDANAKFTELYGGDGAKTPGKEYGAKKKTKKDSRMEEMQSLLDAQAAQIQALMNGETKDETKDETKVKKKKAKVAKKLRLEAEKKKKEEELQAQLAALMKDEEEVEVSDFSDEEEEVEPYEHDGVTYSKTDDGELYTTEGEQWGYIDDEGDVHEGERE